MTLEGELKIRPSKEALEAATAFEKEVLKKDLEKHKAELALARDTLEKVRVVLQVPRCDGNGNDRVMMVWRSAHGAVRR